MPLDILVGAQWGDEGKGRITDLLAEEADIVARYSGGDNAGHTVTVGTKLFKLHLLPSGIVQPRTVAVLGNGMVINPARLLKEMDELAALGMDVSPARIKISAAAHLITPAHIAQDRAEEAARAEGKIGTTGRGIGPAYAAKTARHGLRVELLLDPERLGDAVQEHIQQMNITLQKIYGAPLLAAEAVAAEYAASAQRLAPYITDTSLYLHQQLSRGARVIAEGAQGTLLDIDHGTYPYVTSSSPSAGGVFNGLGIGPKWVGRILGVTKAFQTRVGEGPFPTEAFGAEAERLRGTGSNPWDEFGTTTGRPRRCGWLDLVLLRYAIRVNGLTELALTKLDVLSGLKTVRLCTAYTAHGQTHPELPLGPADLSPFTAVYEELPGWEETVTGVRTLAALPENARRYIRRIEALTGVPVSLVSVGPEREQIIYTRQVEVNAKIIYPRDLAHEVTQSIRNTGQYRLVNDLAEQKDPAALRLKVFLEKITPIPSLHHVMELLDTVFFASLTEEEGRPSVFAIAYVDKGLAVESAWSIAPFAKPMPFTIESIRKLAPATDRLSTSLGVFPAESGELAIWGLIHISQPGEGRAELGCLVIDAIKSGVFIVRTFPEELLLFSRGHYTWLGGDQKLDQVSVMRIVTAMTGSDGQRPFSIAAWGVMKVAIEMLRQGHGGTLLLVPKDAELLGLRGNPRYAIEPGNRRVVSSVMREGEKNSRPFGVPPAGVTSPWDSELQYLQKRTLSLRLEGVLSFVGKLTAVDGATVINSDFELVGFGAMIDFTRDKSDGRCVQLIDPAKPSERTNRIPLSDFPGGARHQSAIHFCFQNPSAVAFVASQDGILSLFFKPSDTSDVIAIRPFHPGTDFLREV